MNEISCPACGNVGLMYPKMLEHDEPVNCTNCGAFVSSYGELKRRIEGLQNRHSRWLPTSGC
jgi:hypothetical protein